MFFYVHSYVVPKKDGDFGRIEEIHTPLLSSHEWPTPDPWILFSLTTKMFNDVLALLKYNRASRLVHLHWTFPIHEFAYIFCDLTCNETYTMYTCKGVSGEELLNLFGEGWWDVIEGMFKEEPYKCNVVPSTVSF